MKGGQLGQWDLFIAADRHQHAAERLEVRPKVAQIADVDRVPLPGFDHRADVFPANRGRESVLGIFDREPVAGQCLTIPIHVEKVAIADAFGKNVSRAGNNAEELFCLPSDLLHLVQVGALNLEAHRRAYAAVQHINAPPDGHGPGIR